MSKVTDFLINLILPAAEAAGEEQLDIVLDKLAANKPEVYKAAMFGLHAGLVALKPEIDPKSKVLVGLVGALEEEVDSSAAKHGLNFDTPLSVTSDAPAENNAATGTEAGPTTGSNAPA